MAHRLNRHSIAGADDIDPNAEGVPFDSTPSLFDTQVFVEVLLNGTISSNGNQGEADSPLVGELRLQSDSEIARDPATACFWQSNVNNQAAMAQAFQQAFAKLSILGQDASKLVDCSDVIPAPPALSSSQAQAFFPPGLNINDVQQSCPGTPFPDLPTAPGAAVPIPSMFVVSIGSSPSAKLMDHRNIAPRILRPKAHATMMARAVSCLPVLDSND